MAVDIHHQDTSVLQLRVPAENNTAAFGFLGRIVEPVLLPFRVIKDLHRGLLSRILLKKGNHLFQNPARHLIRAQVEAHILPINGTVEESIGHLLDAVIPAIAPLCKKEVLARSVRRDPNPFL